MKRKQWSQRLRHVVLMCAAAIGLTAFGDEVSVAKPVVEYGADYTRATVTAAVEGTTSGDVTYELTVTKGATTATYTGTVSDGKVTFADVEVPRDAANIYADITYTVTPKAGTAALTSAATTEAPTTKSEWAFSSTVSDGKVANVGGSWTAGAPTVAENKLAINDATFTPTTKSSDDIVVITMEGVIFGDINDAEITGAQAGIRIGESGKFQVLTTNNAWQETSIEANGEDPYDVVLTINYATKTYSVKIGTGTKDDIRLAGSETGVNAIEFNGAGSLASLAGEAYDGNMVVDKDGNKYATVAAAIAAYVDNSSIAPLTMLHPGTAPACWTIEDGKLVQADITVESTDAVTLVAVPADCKADGLIDLSNRSKGDMLQVNNSKGSYWNWELDENDGVGLYWKKVTRVSTDTEVDDTPDASACDLKAGDAVWVTRKNVEEPIILTATYATAGATIEVAVTTGWKLVAPLPKAEAFDLSALKVANAGSFSEKDMIVIPGAAAPINCVRKDNAWKVYTPKVEDGTNAPEGWGKIATEATWKAAPTIPAGKGFFFVSDGEKTLEL